MLLIGQARRAVYQLLSHRVDQMQTAISASKNLSQRTNFPTRLTRSVATTATPQQSRQQLSEEQPPGWAIMEQGTIRPTSATIGRQGSLGGFSLFGSVVSIHIFQHCQDRHTIITRVFQNINPTASGELG